ncbi:acetate uptake transporter family protein [Blastococcus deserti]|uniref:GPR1/FUN34/yaaH family protein n=1 Tax=Blastococcus deserti TaxID=2259033 RepID=A0ABW4X621_9ACTN
MSSSGHTGEPATRIVLRPVATPLPLGFLALALATTVFSALQLGWIPPEQGRVAAITAMAATVPLQLLASVMGFLARDPVAATGMGILAGTWAVVGLTTYTSPPGSTSAGLGVLLVVSGIAMFVPAISGLAKLVAAAVMGTAGLRFVVTGLYQFEASPTWQSVAGWVGLALAVLGLYAALALELEGSHRRTVLPAGRRGPAASAVRGEGPMAPAELASEPGVRPQL